MASEDIDRAVSRVIIQAMANKDCYQSNGSSSEYQRDQKHLLCDIGAAYADVISQVVNPSTTLGASIIGRNAAFKAKLSLVITTLHTNPGAHRDAAVQTWVDYLTDMKKLVDPRGEISMTRRGGNSNEGLSKRPGGAHKVVRDALKGNFGSLKMYVAGNPEVVQVVEKLISGL